MHITDLSCNEKEELALGSFPLESVVGLLG